MDFKNFISPSCTWANFLRVGSILVKRNFLFDSLHYQFLWNISCSKHRVTMKVTRYQRKRANESDQRIENNKELLSYPYLTVVSILRNKKTL